MPSSAVRLWGVAKPVSFSGNEPSLEFRRTPTSPFVLGAAGEGDIGGSTVCLSGIALENAGARRRCRFVEDQHLLIVETPDGVVE